MTTSLDGFKDCIEYRLIASHYGNHTAKRSGVALINHIDEGLIILNYIGASSTTKRAFCMHPLWQADSDLAKKDHLCYILEPEVVMLTIEYRNIANSFLSDKIDAPYQTAIKLSPLQQVNQMLIADKVQNRKDFVKYHKGTHPRSKQLDLYFIKWLEALNIDQHTYQCMCDAISNG